MFMKKTFQVLFSMQTFRGTGSQDTLIFCPRSSFPDWVGRSLRNNISVFVSLQLAVKSYTETGCLPNRMAAGM